MLLGTVESNLWATKKAAALQGRAFLRVRLEGGRGELVCADCVGAGRGERVLIATGAAARAAAGEDLPIDAAIVGIVDP
ncbi:MAG: EutN/CcmL family microcompartment protein [Oscillospiraceae bacterium]|nr:EutN/CcmL family microcompartment protein [Oscillospiraceae bacterium]